MSRIELWKLGTGLGALEFNKGDQAGRIFTHGWLFTLSSFLKNAEVAETLEVDILEATILEARWRLLFSLRDTAGHPG
jgi:hypothetical protein